MRARTRNLAVAWFGLVLSFGLALLTTTVLTIDPKLLKLFVFFVFGWAGARWFHSWRTR
jgi:hypothetical protein